MSIPKFRITDAAISYEKPDRSLSHFIDGTSTEIKCDTATKVGPHVFSYNSYLTSVDLPEVTEVGQYAFRGCTSLSYINMPKFKGRMPGRTTACAFAGCTSLTTVYFPEYDDLLSDSCFFGCTSLSNVYIPNVLAIHNNAFSGCAIKHIEFNIGGAIYANAFKNCALLNTMIFRNQTSMLRVLKDITAVDGTPFASDGAGGIVLAPREYIESYQTATNWSTLYAAGTCLFWALEDYTVDGTTTGEIDWDKLNTDREGAFVTEGEEVIT